jgi:hypothetical protein
MNLYARLLLILFCIPLLAGMYFAAGQALAPARSATLQEEPSVNPEELRESLNPIEEQAERTTIGKPIIRAVLCLEAEPPQVGANGAEQKLEQGLKDQAGFLADLRSFEASCRDIAGGRTPADMRNLPEPYKEFLKDFTKAVTEKKEIDKQLADFLRIDEPEKLKAPADKLKQALENYRQLRTHSEGFCRTVQAKMAKHQLERTHRLEDLFNDVESLLVEEQERKLRDGSIKEVKERVARCIDDLDNYATQFKFEPEGSTWAMNLENDLRRRQELLELAFKENPVVGSLFGRYNELVQKADSNSSPRTKRGFAFPGLVMKRTDLFCESYLPKKLPLDPWVRVGKSKGDSRAYLRKDLRFEWKEGKGGQKKQAVLLDQSPYTEFTALPEGDWQFFVDDGAKDKSSLEGVLWPTAWGEAAHRYNKCRKLNKRWSAARAAEIQKEVGEIQGTTLNGTSDKIEPEQKRKFDETWKRVEELYNAVKDCPKLYPPAEGEGP